MLSSETIIKNLLLYDQDELSRFCCMILAYNPIVGSYNRIQHVIILELESIQFYLDINSQDNVE